MFHPLAIGRILMMQIVTKCSDEDLITRNHKEIHLAPQAF
jgi:hypothetical protein